MVTPEMLLFLAEKVAPFLTKEQYEKESSSPWRPDMAPRYDAGGDHVSGYRTWYDEQTGEIGGWDRFKWNNPATDDAQFGRLVVWAAMQGLEPDFSHGIVRAWPAGKDYPCGEENENTPDSIRASAVVAICRALGFDAAMEAAK